MDESRKRGTENRQSRDQTSNSRAAQARKRRAGQATRGTPQKKKPLTDRRGRHLKERTVSIEGQRRPKKKGNSMIKVNLVLLGLIVLLFIGLFLTSRLLLKEQRNLYTLSTDTEYTNSNAVIQREYDTVKEEYERFKLMKAEGFEKEVERVSEEWRTVKQAFEKGPEVVNVYE